MRKKVLILEDDSDLLTSYAEVASTIAGCDPVLAKCQQELIEQSQDALACQMALLDLNLGQTETSGIDVFNWLRQKGFEGQIYFATGHGESHPLVVQACELQRTHVLPKPMSLEQLLVIFKGMEL